MKKCLDGECEDGREICCLDCKDHKICKFTTCLKEDGCTSYVIVDEKKSAPPTKARALRKLTQLYYNRADGRKSNLMEEVVAFLEERVKKLNKFRSKIEQMEKESKPAERVELIVAMEIYASEMRAENPVIDKEATALRDMIESDEPVIKVED